MKRYLGKKRLIRIYIDNTDKYNGKPLWEEILKQAKENSLAGATVLKAVAGIGANTELHTSDIWMLSQKLPLIIEIIDDEDKILKFIDICSDLIGEGMVTITDVEVLRYKNVSGDSI